jgi:energy-coupling factor transporter ATP-binding protein EcfA2
VSEYQRALGLQLITRDSWAPVSIMRLQYVDGASWDPDRVCLADTRTKVIESILFWIENPGNTNILLLTGVAGSGKSTIAHTVAQLCHSKKQLVTSFFFDSETNDRNNPRHLFSTIATDLCRRDARIASRIASVIEEDESLAGAPISRQFGDLILQASGGLESDQPLVILLDALDEGSNADLLRILSTDAARLPACFRLVLTSRMYPELGAMRRKSHVRSLELHIHEEDNLADIARFIPHRLKQVAEYHELEEGWPGQELTMSFEARSEGLFLWVATICDYLSARSNPTAELRKLVSTSPMSHTSAEAKMDGLYVKILEACDWSDEDFVTDYHRLMGAAVATKRPLPLPVLDKLYEHTPLASNLVLRRLSPLLTGLSKGESYPVRFLHLSFRDFLTQRAKNSMENNRFAIDEKEHSQILAYLCLCRMNSDLNSSIPHLGYIARDNLEVPGIPKGSLEMVPEELWYACVFWVQHVLDIAPTTAVLEQLHEFLASKLILWLEVVAMCGRYEGISSVLEWVQVRLLVYIERGRSLKDKLEAG